MRAQQPTRQDFLATAPDDEAEQAADLILALAGGTLAMGRPFAIATAGGEALVCFYLPGEPKPRRYTARVTRLAVRAMEADPIFKTPALNLVLCDALARTADYAVALSEGRG